MCAQALGTLTKRQQYILTHLEGAGPLSNREITEITRSHFDASSRATLIRDLNRLLELHHIKRSGKGRGVFYETCGSKLLRCFDPDAYFRTEPDRRKILEQKIDFSRALAWKNVCDKDELRRIDILTTRYKKRAAQYSKEAIKRELERITIEFAWKSSHIEGNAYSLLDTERLIKDHIEARGKTREEAIMILNHKSALEYGWKHSRSFLQVSPRKIEEIHELLTANLDVARGLRRRPVGIIGTRYIPRDNVYQIREQIQALCALENALSAPFLKAIIAAAGIAYIQPFEDGNKRTSRLLGNAILLAFGYCPLSYRNIDEVLYKKAIILFYEQHSLCLFKKLFMEQYEFAVTNYFL